MKRAEGRLISLEGIERVGKTSQVSFIQRYLSEHHIELVVSREPGGTPLAEAIRQLLLHLERGTETLTPAAELLLLFAARAQHIEHTIKPALQSGKWVLCDRFTEASYAYQGGGRGLALDRIAYLQQWIHNGLSIDCVLLLDAPVELALERKRAAVQRDNIEMESADFFTRVRAMYLERARQWPQLYRIIDASLPLASVQQQIVAVLTSLGVDP